MIHKLIYIIGQKIRNPSIKSIFSFLKKTEKWSLNELENYQLEKVNELLDFAIKYSTFYKEKYKDVNVKINSLEDLKKLPYLNKEELLKNALSIQTTYSFKKVFKAVTSGTSGNSLTFFRDEFSDSFNRASINRGYSWHSVQPWNKNGYFWGFNFTFYKKIKTSLLDLLQNRFRVFSYEEKEFNKFVRKLKNARYIHGYSSMIYQTARLINQNKLPKPKNLKMIKGTSEKIYDNYQNEILSAFGKRIINEYGATESGIIGFECAYGSIHINMEGVIVEVIDNEILITNLQMKSFPIIRYKLGDYVELASDKKCKCGLEHKIIKEITGRIGKNIYGINNIYPSLYFYYIFKNLDKIKNIKLNYKIVQKEKGKLEFFIEEHLSDINNKYLISEIEKYFKQDISFIINDGSNVFSKKKKTTSFTSYLE